VVAVVDYRGVARVLQDFVALVVACLADSFGFVFWIAFALTALIIIPASLLPRRSERTTCGCPSDGAYSHRGRLVSRKRRSSAREVTPP
jgi:hypothetical protein